MRKVTFCLFLIAATVSSFAETPPPTIPIDAVTRKATMKTQPSKGLMMGAFYVRLEKTTLADVRNTVGVGDISHRGDAGDSIYWVCYTNVAPARVERVWVASHGEMGGRDHRVTDISAELLPNPSPTPDCPSLPERFKPLILDSQLWLGASENDASARFGPPSYYKTPWLSFDYQGKLKGNCDGGFDLMNHLLLRIKNGRVNYLHAGQVTSC